MRRVILLTGVAGFIGSKVAEFLLADGHTVVGIDNLNNSCDSRLKQWRLEQLADRPDFSFHCLDITDRSALMPLFDVHCRVQRLGVAAVINMAARAGIRHLPSRSGK